MPIISRDIVRTCAIVVIALVIQALALAAMGHPVICACGHISLWYANPAGPETSQQLTDWYTWSHVTHGFLFYLALWIVFPRMPIASRFALAVGMEAGWEIIENTPFIIERYRESALARGYFGDSVINSLVDTVAAMLGFALARKLPVLGSVAAVVAIELFLLYMIRDNLALNIIQLLYPSDAISRWQTHADSVMGGIMAVRNRPLASRPPDR